MAVADKKITYTAAEVAELIRPLAQSVELLQKENAALKRKLEHMNEVFANAQTGNIALCGMAIAEADWIRALKYATRSSISFSCRRSASFKLIALCCKFKDSVGDGSAMYHVNERKNISS